MYLTVYRMRADGHRLAGRHPALRKGVRGWLEYRPTPLDSYGPRMEAHLLDRQGGKDLVPPLYRAQLRRVAGVMHLAGWERLSRGTQKAKATDERQSWLCAVNPADAESLLGRVYVPGIPGYSPEDDYLP